MADMPLPNYNSAPVGGIPAPQPTYPVQNPSLQQGASGGLVNKAAQAQAGVMNGLAMGNQYQQMRRASQNYEEGQASHAANAQAGALPPPTSQSQTGDGHADFFHSIANSPAGQAIMAGVHAIGNALTGGRSNQPAAPAQAAPAPQGPPAPTAAIPPQSAPQGLADGGPVTDSHGNEIHKSTWGELAQQAVKEVGGALFGSGAGARAADASRGSVDNAANKAEIESKMGGGVIGMPSHAIPPSHRGGGFGVSDAGMRGIQGFEAGGAIPPSPAAAAQVGAANGQDMSAAAQQQGQAAQQYSQGQAANGASAAAAAPPPAHQLATVVEQIHQEMLDHTLNDAGVPNKDATNPNPSQALATPNTPAQGNQPSGVQAAQTAQATQAAQQNPAAQQGQPEQPATHSISQEQWDKWDANIDHAVQLAAQAGQNPSDVRAALEANRNAWVQGHVLRNLSAANVALLNGDSKGVETALKNAYYYMPDGRDLTVQKDANGRLTYQDPVQPTKPVIGSDGKPTGQTEPNMVPVDAAHIQLLGQAMLDPMTVNGTIMSLRSSASQIQHQRAMEATAQTTAEGNYWRGKGIYLGADAKQREVDATNYQHLAEGDKDRALAAWWKAKVTDGATTDGKLDPTLARMGQQAGTEYDNIALGRQTIVPTTVPDPKHPGQMVPNLDPNAGKPTRDMSQVPPALKTLTPEQHAANKATASDIALANHGTISPARAADIVTRMQVQRHGSHPGPDGKPQPDVLLDKGQGTGHVWDRQQGTWINFRLHPNTAQSIKSGAQPDPAEVMAAVASGQGSGIPPSGEVSDPEATAPDMESPSAEPS